jgi:hypothetical protein
LVSARAVEWGALLVILCLAAYLRFTGLAWDAGYLFHPDERQILLVVSRLEPPATLSELLSPSSSLNPRFFAYGSFPIYLLRVLAPFAPPTNLVGPWEDDHLAQVAFLGRALSAAFDLGTLCLVFVFGRRAYDARVGLLAAACLAVTVLHIQLAHFYTVDTILTFWVLATLYGALRYAQAPSAKQEWRWQLFTGICLGLALATKVSAVPLLVPVAFACWRRARGASGRPSRPFSRGFGKRLVGVGATAFVVFLATQPYALIDWYVFGRDVIRETLVARGWVDFPYTRQYADTIPFVYQIVQSSVWGTSAPLGIFAWAGAGLFVVQWARRRDWVSTFLVAWFLAYGITVGLQYAKYLRYLAPLLPVVFMMAAAAWFRIYDLLTAAPLPASGCGKSLRWVASILGSLALALALVYSVAFVRIYDREHPWLSASRWMYRNIPSGARLLTERWDESLPVLMDVEGVRRRGAEYSSAVVDMYEPDTDAKRSLLARELARAEAVVLASQRMYASIGKLGERYPLSVKYYGRLFAGDLGFSPRYTSRNDPGALGVAIRDDPRAGLDFDASGIDIFSAENAADLTQDESWNWGFADESWSVYDHPQPIIFVKTRPLTAAQLYELLK